MQYINEIMHNAFEQAIIIHPSCHGKIHGTFQECFACTFENDPLIVQNESCMNVHVRIFIEYSELNGE